MNLPELPLSEWAPTKMTLHLFLQVAGKIKLKKMPRKNHWWNMTLFVNARGFTTNTISDGENAFEIQFNLIEHRLEIFTSSSKTRWFELKDGLPVSEFYQDIMQIIHDLDISVHIVDRPYSLPDENPITTPFNKMDTYASYDKEYVEKFWRIMLWVNNVFTEFSGRFYGKTCPVQLYWHHMDLAVTRFSGSKVPLDPAMSVQNKDAYSHELISFGFWAGDDKVPAPAFYCYAHPSPEGLEKSTLTPVEASWQMNNGSPMAILMYDDVRSKDDPTETLLQFLESAYTSAAHLAGWNIEDLNVPPLDAL